MVLQAFIPGKFDFDVLELNPPFSPEIYRDAIKAAENAGYAVIVIDSLSHAWEGEGGALDMADDATKRQKGAEQLHRMAGSHTCSPCDG